MHHKIIGHKLPGLKDSVFLLFSSALLSLVVNIKKFITANKKCDADLINVNDPPAGVFAVSHDAEVYQVVSGVALAEIYFDMTCLTLFDL